MSDLSTRLRRLLFLVPYAARHQDGVSVDELAAELGIKNEQLLADLDLLSQVGPPGGDPGEFLLITVEDGRVFVDLAQRLTRPLRLTPAEGTSLLLGVHALRQSNVSPYDEALESAERKLLLALGNRASVAEEMAERTVVASEGGVFADFLRKLLLAARNHQTVEVDYSSLSSGLSKKRGIQPYGIVQHNGAWYLIGRCLKNEETRTFRVDRIAALNVTDQTFAVPNDFDLETYRRERLYVPSADALTVKVRLDKKAAARVGAAWPAGEVVPQPDGGAEISIESEGLKWITSWVLSFGQNAEILSPPEARTAMRERVEQMQSAAA